MKIIESLAYIGPNRRANVCLIENLLELSIAEQQCISANAADYASRMLEILQAGGVQSSLKELLGRDSVGSALEIFALMYAAAAIAIQRAAGHRVQFMGSTGDVNPNRVRSLFEYEQFDVGDRADSLVQNLLAEAMPELEWENFSPRSPENFSRSFEEFREIARSFILPPDTEAIINAAARLDIPCVKLEREPYSGVEGDFRLRKNSMLKLGHSIHQHIVDGTFCIDKAYRLFPMVRNRRKLFQMLRGLNVTDEALWAAIEKAHRISNDTIFENRFSGETFKAILANGELIAVTAKGSERDFKNEMHPETVRMVLNLAQVVGTGLLVADIVTSDISVPLEESGGALVGLDMSPELDRILPANGELHQNAMLSFVRWLFPEGTPSRIPLVCVTGTNGKTTTCRMITSVMQSARYVTGLACSDGVYIDSEQIEEGDQSGQGGHHRVLESKEVNMGVLETARGALTHSGFMFDWCNVAVCLNVTMDHLGEHGVDTLEQMAALKRSVLERARDGIVLCADDEYCIGMLPYLHKHRTCLVSATSTIEVLSSISKAANCFSLLEEIDGSDWMVLYDGGDRTAVIEVNDVPATFSGIAKYNVSNALHALAASYLMGVEIATIREGLRNFEVSFEASPGRLNFYHEHPFTVLLDYAHNADGFSKLCEVVDQLEVAGKKVLMMQARGDYGDEFVSQLAAATAGHFDHYVCRSHPAHPGLDPLGVTALMKNTLMDCGVADSQVTTTTDPEFALETTLQMGSEGDLLVFSPGHAQRIDTWERVLGYSGE